MTALSFAQHALSRTVTVLIVSADARRSRALREALRGDARFHAHGARNVQGALELLQNGRFDAAIVDAANWGNPESGVRYAFQAHPRVGLVVAGVNAERDESSYGERPVVFCDTTDDRESLREAVMESVEAARGLRRRDTMVRWLERETTTDALSGLNNARAFHEALRGACGGGADSRAGVVVLNVVGTTMVNHNYGREAGDRMLRHTAIGISRSIRGGDVAARLEDDTFAVMVPGADLDLCRRIARRIVQELDRANDHDWQGDVPVAVTIGMAAGFDCDPTELLRKARQQLGRYRPYMPPPPAVERGDEGPSVA